MDNIISMRSVRKEFKGKAALKNLDFTVKKGEIFGFLGPSGAGKTTSIKLLTSQLASTSGKIEVFGREVLSNRKELINNIGVLSDNSALYERLSIFDNLKLFADIYGLSKEDILYILDKVGLKDERNKQVKKLSKGMKQRVMIARAIAHKPKLLFLDEPTAALDPGTVLKIHKLLKEINEEGTTIFLTTHNMEEADKLCHRVAFLNDGKIVQIGSPEELKLEYMNDDIKVLLRDSRKQLSLKNNRESGKRIYELMEAGKLLTVHSVEPTLEDIFLELTGREL